MCLFDRYDDGGSALLKIVAKGDELAAESLAPGVQVICGTIMAASC